ncbi:L-lactate dehydrogenase complex protein LldG [Paraburkholderia terricola]|jgi:L-lactate dehydrogenase complex protein LldG|uniref:L-lactate dehydrogenase complex protein LldG n=1 Tax=Paraburkholderia terricola TaxID=169427 RepID=A0A1M6W2G9_9BURK|nr:MULTISPECIES: lactate utilization protein C [Paraburkholderia]MDR6494712.1 L-lactate dehydrogenase complex protein LldG [Paraburkholderia terricola]SDP15008.1 L-lactate dehydrogenase complex protein LldG [Paraburkholderia sediminicola]SHK87972.1 L-lactate dehydrogenase complex protein LldG [Paraburkholderia terricola]
MDTSIARRNILARIRAAQGREPEPSASEREAAADYLARHPSGPRPEMPADLSARFIEEAQKMATTVDTVQALSEAPAAAHRYLTQHALPLQAIAWQTLQDLPWDEAGLAVEFRKPRDGDVVGLTGCFCATAETGTLVLLSGPQTYASAGLLPETHIAIVPASRIVAGHEEAFALIRSERGELPRAVNFISGPSRTGDIEQTIVLGAHGPYRVHVIVVQGA